MRHVLALRERQILERFAHSNVLLAFDYDGTLAPIVADPDGAGMRAATRRLLDAITRCYVCVVISGRAQADVRRRLGGVAVAAVIGNHGLDASAVPARVLALVRRWRLGLERRLAPFEGVAVEDKGLSLAVHYRRSGHKRRARHAIRAAAATLGRDVRVVGGKQVVNLLPLGLGHKGLALARERERWGCDAAIYVGDDDTDEDVFTLDGPVRLLAIRVGRKRDSAARYYLRGQAEIDTLLRVLLHARRGWLRRMALPGPRAARPPLPRAADSAGLPRRSPAGIVSPTAGCSGHDCRAVRRVKAPRPAVRGRAARGRGPSSRGSRA